TVPFVDTQMFPLKSTCIINLTNAFYVCEDVHENVFYQITCNFKYNDAFRIIFLLSWFLVVFYLPLFAAKALVKLNFVLWPRNRLSTFFIWKIIGFQKLKTSKSLTITDRLLLLKLAYSSEAFKSVDIEGRK